MGAGRTVGPVRAATFAGTVATRYASTQNRQAHRVTMTELKQYEGNSEPGAMQPAVIHNHVEANEFALASTLVEAFRDASISDADARVEVARIESEGAKSIAAEAAKADIERARHEFKVSLVAASIAVFALVLLTVLVAIGKVTGEQLIGQFASLTAIGVALWRGKGRDERN